MKTKRILSLLLAMVMVLAVLFTACTEIPEENETSSFEQSESSENETSSQEAEDKTEETSKNESDSNVTVEGSSDTEKETETEEESEVITDVMIGETLEAEYAADFTVAKIFSSDMVVQRNEHIRVWGFAPESENGKKVSGEFKGMFAEAIIENGEWCITFGARLEADVNGADMKIYTDEKETVFSGVLVGDVYLIMGQSNAAHTVNTHIANSDSATQGGGKDAIDQNSIIRLNYINGSGGTYSEKGTDYVYKDLENTKFWTRTTVNDTLSFSALGYYFARQMVEKTDNTVPVGLIEVARGGAPMGSFLPNDLADQFDTDYYNSLTGKYLTFRSSEHQGRYLYNCYLAPIQKYAVAGIVWYQGESNNEQQYAESYCAEFEAFIERLRSTHNVINKDIPVFAIELPSIYQKPEGHTGDWHFMELGVIRSYMGLLPTVVDNCYMASGSDMWGDKTFYNNLHPNCKFEQAARLADIAASVLLGKGTLDDATGPIFKSIEFSADKKTAVITFTTVGEGLTTADGGSAVKGIVGVLDKEFIITTVSPVSATITAKDQITVEFDEAVKAVAYNYRSTDYFGETVNLCNSAEIPALAFMTPYTERDVKNYTPDSFVEDTDASVKRTGKAIDSMKADGVALFTTGKVASELATAGNAITINEGTGVINLYGWVGFQYEILKFGYSIDDGNAVFKASPTNAGSAVEAAGGKYAKRFSVNIFSAELTPGKHTVNLLALINKNEGVAVKILTFTVNVAERKPAPEGLKLPKITSAESGLIACAHDELKVAGVSVYKSNIDSKLEAVANRVTIKQGTTVIGYSGWLGFNTTIDKLGYSIDGTDPVINTATLGAEQAVINRGGANAKRYLITVPTGALSVGEHTVDLIVRINTADGGTANFIINTLTIVVEEAK